MHISKGYVRTEEQRKAMSLIMKGKNLGKKHTPEHIEKVRLKLSGLKRTDEQKQRYSLCKIKLPGNSNLDRQLRRKYPNGMGVGIPFTEKDYNELFAKQNGVCAICSKPELGIRYTNLAIDHDHKTGLVRGLLCNSHNLLLGYAGDDTRILNSASQYISSHMIKHHRV